MHEGVWETRFIFIVEPLGFVRVSVGGGGVVVRTVRDGWDVVAARTRATLLAEGK